MLLVDLVAEAGARDIVFAGGDPSLRRDIGRLCVHSRDAGLRVEVQTNADIWPTALQEALSACNTVALSLDGATPQTHDKIRQKDGNFRRVLAAMDWLEEHRVDYRVRSVITSVNVDELSMLGELLVNRPHLVEWGLQELTKIGDAVESWDRLKLNIGAFQTVANVVQSEFGTKVKIIRADDKRGAYAMVRSDGSVYGTLDEPSGGFYPVVGSLMSDHLSSLAARLPFDSSQHSSRYDRLSI